MEFQKSIVRSPTPDRLRCNRSKHPRHCFYAPARKHPVVTREAIAVTSLPSGDILMSAHLLWKQHGNHGFRTD
ncbi:MAG: hypothetical protein HWQ43_26315 [Nostoc sp. JL31]|uniref:hypothetical protein n=1 Tax=Nostoc sp. JL31 TaxID=2815395 RepID=UPI0025D73AD4|nr:hypothetical protein [Nostoc sp. JL31]MBN3892509.1 hypothetical protein [Nostoc sp. JL31]